MKRKYAAILLVTLLLLSGCRGRQPIKTPEPSASPVSLATASASASANNGASTSGEVPKLPERFGDKLTNQTSLKVYDIKTKKVSEVTLEEYMEGVLAGEMRQDWPPEALKAQAIIARTFLMQFLTENKTSKLNKEADISTDPEESQAYDPTGINDNIKKAVNDTNGLVIAYQGKFARAWFHSASGGKTADAVEGLNFQDGNPPYIVSVDSDESQIPKEFSEWNGEFTATQISAALKKMSIDVGADISEISISKTGASGRATVFSINGKDVPAPEFRVAMDPLKFRSTFITDLKFDGAKLSVKGKGFGHGVGMPQWGAYQMAQSGKTATDIIQYYFKGVDIVSLWK